MSGSTIPDSWTRLDSHILSAWIDRLLSGVPLPANLSQCAPPVDPRHPQRSGLSTSFTTAVLAAAVFW